jgi:hypothetical protein
MLEPILIALAVAAALGVAWRARHSRGLAVFAILWLLYAGYEYLMYARIACSGECNIRVDLLLIYPVLLIGTPIAAWKAVFHARRRDDG